MIAVALGANLPSPRFGPPRATCEAALAALAERGVRVLRRSRWYRSAPLPPSDQPDFVNGVVAVETKLDPATLLARLHEIEAEFGRRRGAPNAARLLDLDLLVYHDRVNDGTRGGPILPHPRMLGRAFVLLPLRDVAPDWRHPVTGEALAELIAALPSHQEIEPLD
ncbi:MAG TPA: 2-amino-4-hydroxy-6-hydroxymethyldihydropteridine diphosphokinase [Alphaproteobacteria bacterium]|nr:2-amino-4-hydroxy-6-hydroxymethyldihydropteridine diphosphokinase [Alphaproteobacteria bacterium]